jgi:heme A synthase
VTVLAAWVVFRRTRPIVPWLATASLVAIAAEGAVGGVVVVNELAPWLVVIHLGLAMLILGFLIATAILSLPAAAGAGNQAFRRLAVVATAATYLLLLTGSTVVASEADETCHAWPLCGGGFSFDFTGASVFTMLHRGGVLLIGILLVYALLRAIRISQLRSVAIATLVVFGLQVAVGAGSAITDGALFNGLHVAIATLVWSGMLSIALLTVRRADRSPALSRLAVDKRPA